MGCYRPRLATFGLLPTQLASFAHPRTRLPTIRYPTTQFVTFQHPTTQMAIFQHPHARLPTICNPSTQFATFQHPHLRLAILGTAMTRISTSGRYWRVHRRTSGRIATFASLIDHDRHNAPLHLAPFARYVLVVPYVQCTGIQYIYSIDKQPSRNRC